MIRPSSDPVQISTWRQRREVYRMLRRWRVPRLKAVYSAARATEVYIRAVEARR